MNVVHSISAMLSSLPTIITAELPHILQERSSRQLKPDGSYVTGGDLLVQEIILSHVAGFLPHATVVSEESELNETEKCGNLIVVIDPIDGTENFTSGLREWGTAVACYRNGRHAASLLGCPELDLWIWSGASMTRFTSRIHGLSSSLSKDDLLAVTEGCEYRILGCCVYNMINVIRGSFRSFENPKGAYVWDILAGLNLALEHGLSVTVNGEPYAGEYLTPDRKYRFKVENR